jgi:hypothetical protein
MRISGKLLSSTDDTLNKIKTTSGWRQQIFAIASKSDEQAVCEIITANIIRTIQSGGISMIGELYQNVETYAHDASQVIDIDEIKVISNVMRNL